MTSRASRRRYTDSPERTREGGRITGRDARTKQSEHRHRSHRSERDGGRDRDERFYVYKDRGSDRPKIEGRRSEALRRSNTTGEDSRATQDRIPRLDRAEQPGRRHSEKWTPREEEESLYNSLRRDKRSVAENITKQDRERIPSRSASARDTRPPSIFRPLFRRSATSTRTMSGSGPSSQLPPFPPSAKPMMRKTSEHHSSARPASSQALPLATQLGTRARGKPEHRSSARPSSHLTPSPPSPSKSRIRETTGQASSASKGKKTGEQASSVFPFLGSAKPSKWSEPKKTVDCSSCLCPEPVSDCIKLSCAHYECKGCLRMQFDLSIREETKMPPRCAGEFCDKVINPEYVNNLYDTKFKKKWNEKYIEFTSKNRLYCPTRGCGTWIKPKHIHLADLTGRNPKGRTYGKCKRCGGKCCTNCRNKWHSSDVCPEDIDFLKVAKEKGMQQCFSCKEFVERESGCNHMTCRCGAQFCIICGAKWWSCKHPMFPDHMMQVRRSIELADLALAQRMQEEEDGRRRHNPGPADDFFLENDEGFIVDDDPRAFRPPHFMDEQFMRRAAEALSAVFDPAEEQHPARQTPQHQPPILLPLRPSQPSTNTRQSRSPGRTNERLVPRRAATDYASEAEIHRPFVVQERASLLAGIGRGRAGNARVDEWRRHVGPLL